MKEIFHVFYIQPMTYVYVEFVVIYLFWTIAMIILRGRVGRIVAVTGTCLSIVLIIMCALFTRSFGEKNEMSFIPFISFTYAKTQPEFYRTMFMNVLLFLPLGLSLPFAVPNKIKHKALISILCGLLLSVFIEATQLILHLGRCEIDDIIMNTLGVVIGITSYLGLKNIRKKEQKCHHSTEQH